jgi:hypothetical protein
MSAQPELRRAWRMLVCSTALVSLCGCGLPLYLHKDSYEKETAEVKKTVDELDVKAAYASLTSDAKEVAKLEDSTVMDALIARRNAELVKIIDPFPGNTKAAADIDARLQLAAAVQSDIDLLAEANTALGAGSPGLGAEDLERSFAATRRGENDVGNFLRLLQAIYATKTAQQGERKPPAWSCDAPEVARAAAAATPYPPKWPDNRQTETGSAFETRLSENIAGLKLRCVQRKAAWQQRTDLLKKLADGASPGTDVSIPSVAQNLVNSLTLRQVLQRDAEKFSAELNAKLDSVDKTEARRSIIGAIKKMKPLVGEANALAQFAGWETFLTYTQCGLATELMALGQSADKGDDAAGDTEARAAATPSATDAAADGSGKSKEKDETKTIACEAGKSGIQLGDNGDANPLVVDIAHVLIGIQSDAKVLEKAERLDAEIMAIADLRQRVSIAKAQVEFGALTIQLQKARLHALLEQLRFSQQARADLEGFADAYKGKPVPSYPDIDGYRKAGANNYFIANALAGYTQSWDNGRIPAELLNYRMVQARRNYDITVAAVTADNYRELLKPIAASLAAYGAGGITPELLGQLLGNAAIIAGVGTL